jgi:glycosyltransferase involved in cell wall biosynthesis
MSLPETDTGRTVSVVVAAQNARSTVVRCLAALEQQRRDGVGEIILVDNSSDGTADLVRQGFPAVEVIRQAGRALVPELWAVGILQGRGHIVALTTAEMVPEPGWARALLAAHATGLWAGVGGPILAAQELGRLDRAVYWLRYSGYAMPRPSAVVPDIAGDNASYPQQWLLSLRGRIGCQGFWDNEIHRLFRRCGGRLLYAPDAVVRYHGGIRFGPFARQRLVHGRRFGAHRVAGLRGTRRLLVIAVWPLTPLTFLARICRNALRAGDAASLTGALPGLLFLLGCWSTGELLGYLWGPAEDRR